MAKLNERQRRALDRTLKRWGVEEEDRKDFLKQLDEEPEEDEAVAPNTEDEIDKAESDIEEKGEDSQSEKDRVNESVGEQEKLDGDEDSQDAKARVDESEGEEKAVEEEKKEDDAKDEERAVEEAKQEDKKVFDALVARLDALEDKVGKLLAEQDDKPFGEQPQSDYNDDYSASEDAIMRSYNPAYRR